MDDVGYVNNVIKGESVSYPQAVRNFGDNYIYVITSFKAIGRETLINATELRSLFLREQVLNLQGGTNCLSHQGADRHNSQ